MWKSRGLVVCACMFVATVSVYADTHVRIASYNIKYLSTESMNSERLVKLKAVIEDLGADIIGLQEIDDRAALEQLFDPAEWWIVIDDDSGQRQDLAVVVRRGFSLEGFTAGDLDADDEHFLFEGTLNNKYFPKRRDLLCVGVNIPGVADPLYVMVHHGKSRMGGRASNDHRRVGASRAIIQKLEHDFHDMAYVLMGDFNDNPDDASMNILESGNPNATGGPENTKGPFLINLFEPLCAADHVSHGRKSNDIVNGVVVTIDPGSRDRNNSMRGTDQNSGDILFDQILVPPHLLPSYAANSAAIYHGELAAKGNNSNRASDHLPVFADFVFGDDDGGGNGEAVVVRIVGLLVDPAGNDRGREQVTLQNFTSNAIDLADWKLVDRANNIYRLSGTLAAGATQTITMQEFSMPLNQSGDTVRLYQGSIEIHQVTYTSDDVTTGQALVFEQ